MNKFRAKGRIRAGRGRSKLEDRYAELLEVERAAGTVIWWARECLSLRIAESTHYRPDFLVMHSNQLLTIVDVKGRAGRGKWNGQPFHFEEDSWIKIKTVAAMFPFRVVVAYPSKSGGWEHLEV